ncbi:MAG: 50S ribosomal protein L35ae [Thermoprotei archaeon]|nr:MAG: 50S ribosomal protein L35ae [Thermoprotei archaeon]RLE98003.1 MAG: 50S ribosomal protein L35ae [Thermoprotei archaeon]HDI75424.1 50S ribosomal protein L35ae [Thermoprotei archaeon]
MKGAVISIRRGLKRQYPNQAILVIKGVNSFNEACRLIGRKVILTLNSNKRIIGKIIRAHGKKGKVIARFRKPLPGQVIGTKVEIL